MILWCVWHWAIDLHVANTDSSDSPLCQTKAQDGRWILCCSPAIIYCCKGAEQPGLHVERRSFLVSQPPWVKFNPDYCHLIEFTVPRKQRGEGKKKGAENSELCVRQGNRATFDTHHWLVLCIDLIIICWFAWMCHRCVHRSVISSSIRAHQAKLQHCHLKPLRATEWDSGIYS